MTPLDPPVPPADGPVAEAKGDLMTAGVLLPPASA